MMNTHERVEQYGGLSFASVAVTAAAITGNHLYTLGTGALILGVVLLVVPAALLKWLRKTASTTALVGYMLMNVWMIIGFGLLNGLWAITLKVFLGTFLSSMSTAYPKPPIGPFAFEISGTVMFIGSMFVLYYALKLLPWTPNPDHRVALVTGGLVAAVVVLIAYTIVDRDRWRPPANGIVKIGVIVPTVGPYALLGSSFVKAVEMAKDDLRDTKYRYELVIRDSGPDPVKAEEVIRKVITEDRVAAIVGGISLIGQVTKPYATYARIPHVCVCTVTSIGDGAYNFTNIPSPEAEGIAWVREAQRRQIKTIALISQDYPSINNHVKALKADAARAGLAITYEHRFDDGVTDFRPVIAEAAASTPDVFYVEALNPGLDLLGEQFAEADIHNISSVVAPSLSQRPELFEGAWYTDSDLQDIGFRKRFEDKYPGTQFATHMMPYAYDSLNMIVQAFERGQNPAVYLRNLTMYDGTADRLTKEPGSGNFKSAPAVWVVRNGKPTLLAAAQLSASAAEEHKQ
jgi:ABC-type branched-subunit amino acid transport system substrate-binding protein